jgi:hypothetical protein
VKETILEAIRFGPGFHKVPEVTQMADHGGDDVVAEDFTPAAEGLVAGDDEAGAFSRFPVVGGIPRFVWRR